MDQQQQSRRYLRSQGDAPPNAVNNVDPDHVATSQSPLTPPPSEPPVPLSPVIDGLAPRSLQSEVGNGTSNSNPPPSIHDTPSSAINTAPQALVQGAHPPVPTVEFLMQQNQFLLSSLANMRDELRSFRQSQSREPTPAHPPSHRPHAPKLKRFVVLETSEEGRETGGARARGL
ncbi:hypothetical protein L198_05455 [Cryptococcus wingfieldii CBS 7118]|uniref:Uncharacterized protein n=1 Tax=Cryptococcus wingfieldii CBS 7118 TaxID=1295528 RepID=A0A1E3J0B9_9TREE|nr:hypothetical protein L198_05455 [Cryptococcus wingfieldii CBS 7118]ODN93586.1 hypothetical protein L198_05455 [Cryptococcus wingfieldii CBS 7118]